MHLIIQDTIGTRMFVKLYTNWQFTHKDSAADEFRLCRPAPPAESDIFKKYTATLEDN